MGKDKQRQPPMMSHTQDFTQSTYAVWLNRLFNVAMSRGEWKNLPDTCDSRFIDETLIFQNPLVGFRDDVMGCDLILPAVTSQSLNLYGYPSTVDAYGYNYYRNYGLIPFNSFRNNQNVNEEANCALLYANMSRTPEYPMLLYYARKLTKIDRIMDMNVNIQKTSYLLCMDENTRLSVMNAFKQLENFEPAIVGTKNFDPTVNNPITTFDLPTKYIANDLQILKRQVLEEALTGLGIEANTSEKAERQITGEITANMGETESIRKSYIKSHQIFCEQFNAVTGNNVSFNFNSQLQLQKIIDGIEGGVYDGSLYNDSTRDLRGTDWEDKTE